MPVVSSRAGPSHGPDGALRLPVRKEPQSHALFACRPRSGLASRSCLSVSRSFGFCKIRRSPLLRQRIHSTSEPQRRDVEGLIQSLSDDKARSELIGQLRTLLQVAPPAAEAREDWLADVNHVAGGLFRRVLAVLGEVESLPALASQAAAA